MEEKGVDMVLKGMQEALESQYLLTMSSIMHLKELMRREAMLRHLPIMAVAVVAEAMVQEEVTVATVHHLPAVVVAVVAEE